MDRIEQDLRDRARVIRLPASEGLGRRAAAHYRIRVLPTLLVLDGGGAPTLTQAGAIHREAVLEAVQAIESTLPNEEE